MKVYMVVGVFSYNSSEAPIYVETFGAFKDKGIAEKVAESTRNMSENDIDALNNLIVYLNEKMQIDNWSEFQTMEAIARLHYKYPLMMKIFAEPIRRDLLKPERPCTYKFEIQLLEDEVL